MLEIPNQEPNFKVGDTLIRTIDTKCKVESVAYIFSSEDRYRMLGQDGEDMNMDGTLRNTLRGYTVSVSSVAILGPDRIVSGSYDNTIKIWNTNGECLKTLEGH